jgi:hypothetical protein
LEERFDDSSQSIKARAAVKWIAHVTISAKGMGGREHTTMLIKPKNRQTSGGFVLLSERICPRLPSAHDRLLYLS